MSTAARDGRTPRTRLDGTREGGERKRQDRRVGVVDASLEEEKSAGWKSRRIFVREWVSNWAAAAPLSYSVCRQGAPRSIHPGPASNRILQIPFTPAVLAFSHHSVLSFCSLSTPIFHIPDTFQHPRGAPATRRQTPDPIQMETRRRFTEFNLLANRLTLANKRGWATTHTRRTGQPRRRRVAVRVGARCQPAGTSFTLLVILISHHRFLREDPVKQYRRGKHIYINVLD
ncbi:uncharacterized protein FOMMEDRAFT_154825 [Fomitiporia mediterranea MF3/22]|uniref:uncharacterized protein n=1 Tax=Fomitiporia mediterranea (strain MF3/22) TaxID=694068 RepID=UPI0004407E5A|nr:uncharacterized protein FOMMEDRAFT_154825 [Fomitiporia mediterranea MF3/22]EJD03722.1 hypothetical protein FOMMEDRAFT_154825 [Fomitiporia mediterranea MF3/22]